MLKKKFSGWSAYIITADPLLPKRIRLAASRRIPLFNGALECRLLEYKMIAGGMRRGSGNSGTKTNHTPDQTSDEVTGSVP
jgi:putative N6-adenine-specific DNA methylase